MIVIRNGLVLLVYLLINQTGVFLDWMGMQTVAGALLWFCLLDTIGRIFWRKNNINGIIRFYSLVIIFYFVIVPIYYLMSLMIPVNLNLFLAGSVGTVSVVWFVLFRGYYRHIDKFDEDSLIAFGKRHMWLWIILVVYGVMHMVFYRFYVFIPEWDTYGNLKMVEGMMSGLEAIPLYRPLFSLSNFIISKTTGIPPYSWFSIWGVLLQSLYIITGYRLIGRRKKDLLSFLIVISLLSVPVINMEVDFLRPQSMLMIAIPIVIILIKSFFEDIDTRIESMFLMATILVFGMLYHELFILMLLPLLLVLWKLSSEGSFAKLIKDKNSRLVGFLVSGWLLTLLLYISSIVPTVNYYLKYFGNLFWSFAGKLVTVSEWKLSFLDSYNTDGMEMGWTGLIGYLRYYAYYFSPTLVLFVVILVLLGRLKNRGRGDRLVGLLCLIMVLTFTEIMPRLGLVLLPERLWLFGDVILLIVLGKVINDQLDSARVRLFVSCLLSITIIMGIGGSLFVAYKKKALTTRDEYQVSMWIKENTPKESSFITQPANWPMVAYFADRSIIVPQDELLSKSIGNTTPIPETEIEKRLTDLKENLRSVFNSYDYEKGDAGEVCSTLSRFVLQSRELRGKQPGVEKESEANTYILFSKQKFDNLYGEYRGWWNKRNFADTDVNMVSSRYPLIHEYNGIYIWRVK